MPNVNVTSFLVDGAVAAQVIAPADQKRKYLSVQAQDAGGKLAIGEAAVYIEMADTDIWFPAVNITSKYSWIGDSLECVVIQDIQSDVCLSSDKLMLTYGGTPIHYNTETAGRTALLLATPVFS